MTYVQIETEWLSPTRICRGKHALGISQGNKRSTAEVNTTADEHLYRRTVHGSVVAGEPTRRGWDRDAYRSSERKIGTWNFSSYRWRVPPRQLLSGNSCPTPTPICKFSCPKVYLLCKSWDVNSEYRMSFPRFAPSKSECKYPIFPTNRAESTTYIHCTHGRSACLCCYWRSINQHKSGPLLLFYTVSHICEVDDWNVSHDILCYTLRLLHYKKVRSRTV